MVDPEFIAVLLETAASELRSGQLGRAAWRVADAGLMLREYCNNSGVTGIGIDAPTGCGAMLPQDVLGEK